MKKMSATGKSLIALFVCLALCLVSMIGTHAMLTDNGNVKVLDQKFVTPKGNTVRYMEYRPVNASAENPVPTVVYSPGNDNTAEIWRSVAHELSRRGYAVFVPDLLSAGHSDEAVGNSTTFGFSELIDYVYDNLEYIDNQKISIGGYSKGGNNTVVTLNEYGEKQRNNPDEYVQKFVSALVLAPPPANFTNAATGVNIGFGAGLYDPYSRIGFKPVEGYFPGDLSVKAETKNFINLGVPGTFSEEDLTNPDVKVEIGHVYGSFADGTARVVYNPSDATHALGIISPKTVEATTEFFMQSVPAPNPIPANEQNYIQLLLLSALGFLGILGLTVPAAILLLEVPVFNKLKHPIEAPVSGLKKVSDWLIFVIASLVAGLVPPLMSPVLMQQTSKIFSLTGSTSTDGVFVYGVANNNVVWLLFSALFLLAMFLLFYFGIHKKNGAKISDYHVRIGFCDICRTVLLAVSVVLACRAVVWFADYFFKTDFRVVDLTLGTIKWSHLKITLCYAPFFILYWCINSLIMNGCNRFKGMPEGVNQLICVLCNVLGTAIVCTVYYVSMFSNGQGFGPFGNWKAYMMLSYMVLMGIAGTLINRKIYNATSNLYLGPVIFGILTAYINTTVYTLPAP
ncbi:MAG: alpha/beta fold hydrolase [Clostridia bacterium]|nr:alpha/beta fold hydrolase [Clostridia bacterium]